MSQSEGLGPVGVRSRRRRRRLRGELERAVDELAGRTDRAGVTVWRVQPVIEICTAESYPTWRSAPERAWRHERTQFSTRTWPDRLNPIAIAGVFLPQSHGGHTTAGDRRRSHCPCSPAAPRHHRTVISSIPTNRWSWH
jgi:hypothetical protein